MENDDMPHGRPQLIRSTAFILLECSKCGKKFNSLINGKCDICTEKTIKEKTIKDFLKMFVFS